MGSFADGGHTPTQLPYINVQRFRGGLVFQAHGLVYHSTLGLRVIKKKKNTPALSTDMEANTINT
jgi:hypothetical protein